MPRTGESLYTESTGADPVALERGMRWLIGEARRTDQPGLVVLATKQVVDNLGRWAGDVGNLLISLRDAGDLESGGVTLALRTQRTLPPSWAGPILVIYGGDRLLDAVDGITGACDLLYIPWLCEEAVKWAKARSGRLLGTEPAAGGAAELTVLDIAFDALTSSVNLGTGIAHPADRDEAIRTLETLLHHDRLADAESVRGHLLRRGWDPAGAREVAELAQKLMDGRRPRGSRGKADDGLWEYWSRCLAESDSKAGTDPKD